MIEISKSILKNYKIENIYKNNYIKIYKIYNYDYEYFSKTVSSLTKKLSRHKLDDINLSKFLNFYWRFIKICNCIPIPVSHCAILTENNSNLNIDKIKKTLFVAYPDYQTEFDYLIKKYYEFRKSDNNFFLQNDLNLINNERNLILYDTVHKISNVYKYIKKKNFFLKPQFNKIETITLLNPQTDLLQEIAYLNICDNIVVLNFDWLSRDYKNLDLFVSNKEITSKSLQIEYVATPKPQNNLTNEFKGEIFEEDLDLSSDLMEIFELLNSRNEDEAKIEDKDIKNENELDKVRSTLFQLSNGKIALLRNDPNFDQAQDVIEKSPLGKITIKNKKVDLIQPGEFVLFQGERATTMLEKETQNFVEDANTMYADRKDWKFRFKQEINRLGLDKVIEKIKEYGGRKTTKIHNISYWLNPKSLKSKDKKTFFAIMKVCGLFNKSEEIWLNMEKLEKAHRKAGRIIRQKIEQVVTKNTKPLYEKGYYEYFLDDKGSGSVEVYKIIEKGKSLKIKLSLTDKALLRGDL